MSNLFLGEVASAESESEQMVLCANCFLTLNRKDEFKKHLPSRCLPVADAEVCVRSALSSLCGAFTVCAEICNINHDYLSCDLDVDIEIEEQIYHRLI